MTAAGTALASRSMLGPVIAGRAVRIGYRSDELVASAASMFTKYREPDRSITVAPDWWDLYERDEHGRRVWTPSGLRTAEFGFRTGYADSEQVEGPRHRIEISPGSVRIAATDPVKRERARERASRAAAVEAKMRLAREKHEPHWDGCLSGNCQGCRRYDVRREGTKIRSWSRKSRSAMVHRLATLDYGPLFVNWYTGEDMAPAMVTLTYPGDWLKVAPSNTVCRRHIEQLRKRWDRLWGQEGYPLIGVWKREFQERGAPHYHLLCTPPQDPGFRRWLSETWAEIVGAEWCGERCWESFDGRWVKGLACCERGRHTYAGTGLDYREGARAVDPRRLAVYFSKHGGYASKEYQNEGPKEWAERGGVGRFWGVWGLSPSVVGVELDPATALAIARVVRRQQRTKRFTIAVRKLRCGREEANEHGEVVHEHDRTCFRKTTKVVRRFRGSAGFVVVNDGAALAASLARYAGQVEAEPVEPTRRLSGPVGFLP